MFSGKAKTSSRKPVSPNNSEVSLDRLENPVSQPDRSSHLKLQENHHQEKGLPDLDGRRRSGEKARGERGKSGGDAWGDLPQVMEDAKVIKGGPPVEEDGVEGEEGARKRKRQQSSKVKYVSLQLTGTF